jgi:hypothetical protein
MFYNSGMEIFHLIDVFYPSIQHLGLEVGGLDRILVVIHSKGIGKLVAGDAPTPCSQL